jgi:hypothetical protein
MHSMVEGVPAQPARRAAPSTTAFGGGPPPQACLGRMCA